MPPGHFQFNYKFSDTEGISFGDLPYIDIHGDLLIYYDSLSGDDFVDCWCSRWDVNNYTIIVETILKEEDAYNIIDNTVPGAVGELYEILGRKHYYDMTWNKENTLRLVPHSCTRYTRATQSFSGYVDKSTLKRMRQEKTIYVKNITTNTVEGDDGWLGLKIEAYISGSNL